MRIEIIPVGSLMANCYFLIDEKSKETFIVDPGDEGERIFSMVESNGLAVKAIINTHGHVDHIGANAFLHKKTGAPVWIHPDDSSMLESSRENMSVFVGNGLTSPGADRLLTDGEELQLGAEKIKVLHTPGHTRGGICLEGNGYVITGDTLFNASIGRTDFPGGSYKTIIVSIKQKLMTLPDSMIVYPGHGPESTIGYERKHNPFLN